YNVAFMELVNGVTTGAAGLFLVLGISLCLIASRFPKTAPWQVGRRAQDVVLVFLWLVFAGFFVLLGADILEHYFFPLQATGNDTCGLDGLRQWVGSAQDAGPKPGGGTDLMEVYVASSLRLVPWLGLLVGPLQVITNIVGDVLCYVLPRDFPLSIADAAKR